MKRRNIALTLMASFCLSGSAGLSESRADNPFERLIPRGKLLKKLKDEIIGEEDQLKLPDVRRSNQPRPTAAPTPATRGEIAPLKAQSREPYRTAAQSQPSTRTRPLPPLTGGARKSAMPMVGTKESRGPGFGMMVQASSNSQLVVTGVQQGGNAAHAGIQPGDRLLSAGGGSLSGMDELKQIAKTLGQGDQVEVEFVRQGKKRKALLQFGTTPQQTQIVTNGGSIKGVVESADIDNSMPSVLDSPVERVSRLEPGIRGPAGTAATRSSSTGRITSLNETIQQQQMKMQAMAEELKLLRRAHQPAVEPTKNNWSFPHLTQPNEQ